MCGVLLGSLFTFIDYNLIIIKSETMHFIQELKRKLPYNYIQLYSDTNKKSSNVDLLFAKNNI